MRMKDRRWSWLLFWAFMLLEIFPGRAQNRSVGFQAISLNEALEQARQQNKPVFIDCCTSWCGPCKMMSQTVFTQDTVADFMNQFFIPVKMDMEAGEGPDIGRKYAVQAYPTYLFLNGKGDLIYKFVGAMDGERFLDSVSVSLDPANRFRVMNGKFAGGEYDDAFMRDYIRLKFNLSEFDEGVRLANLYFEKLTPEERARPENWFLFESGPLASRIAYANSRNSNYLTDHWAEFKGQIADSLLYGRISDNFRQITAQTFTGRYFSSFGRDCKQFDAFKVRIKAVDGLQDQEQLLVMMDLAKAVCQNDTALALDLLKKQVAGFNGTDQTILFDFFGFYLTAKQSRTHVAYEIMRRVIMSNRNENLVKYMEYFTGGADPMLEKYDAPNLKNKFGSKAIIPFFHPNKAICFFSWSEPGEKSGFLTYAPGKGSCPVYDETVIDSLLLSQGIDTAYVSMFPSFDEQGIVAGFRAGNKSYVYHAADKSIEETSEKPYKPVRWGLSPDGQSEIFEKDYNFFLRNLEDSGVVQLTSDGDQKAAYQLANLKWISKDGKFVVHRDNTHGIRQMSVINSVDMDVPFVYSYPYELPGDSVILRTELYLGSTRAGTCRKLDVEKWKGQQLVVVNADNVDDRLFFMRVKRTRKAVELCSVDAAGDVKVLIAEACDPAFNDLMFSCKIINRGNDILFWSDRSGWGHYYRYDKNGKLKNSLGSGNWTAGRIVAVDEQKQQVYYNCYGRKSGLNPNYTFLYRVDLTGRNVRLLTPENADHNVSVHLKGNLMVDNYSRIDTVPLTVARTCDGVFLDTVAKPDIRPLLDYGWKFPTQFTLKAADGKTDLYGIMWKPFDFDPDKKYPVISQVYPGPQTETVWTGFTVLDRYNNTALAQRGFIVVCMGHRGASPSRGRAYASYGYGNLRDFPVEDDKYGLEQLARRYRFIDSTKVGIVGHSGGALMAVVAMCTYPDFYKVAVASSGNYDNSIYHRNWGEYYQGIGEDHVFSVKTAMELAPGLKGKLLLVTGESDDNVSPSNTYRMVDSLIKANKDFDLLVLPGQSHHYEGGYKSYFEKRKRDYFSDYLR